ncbi:calcium channel protein [Savitreella phatthalungensis]
MSNGKRSSSIELKSLASPVSSDITNSSGSSEGIPSRPANSGQPPPNVIVTSYDERGRSPSPLGVSRRPAMTSSSAFDVDTAYRPGRDPDENDSLADSQKGLIRQKGKGEAWWIHSPQAKRPSRLTTTGTVVGRSMSLAVNDATSRIVRLSPQLGSAPRPFSPQRRNSRTSATESVSDSVPHRDTAVQRFAIHVMTTRWFEPVILLVILLHGIVLTIDASVNVYDRATYQSWTDWMLIGIFVVYTLEMALRIMSSGLVGPRKLGQGQRLPYLRRSWQRLDFICIVSFWIHVALDLGRFEDEHHIYIFRALSTLRVLRLLNVTRGMASTMQALKIAAPLLGNVAFFVGFFGIFAGIIGTQAFRGSLRRQCVYSDLATGTNYTQDLQFCGGHWLNGNKTGYLEADWTPSGFSPKGYICPEQSYCISDANPYNGTVHFDNLANSLELVFVILSANGFTNIMYWTMDSDYFVASLYFIAWTVILTWWLTALVIAVVTNSLQVVRDEQQRIREEEKLKNGERRSDSYELTARPRWLDKWRKTSWVWLLLIAADLFTQAFKRADMTTDVLERFELAETIFTGIFVVEITGRFFAWHPQYRRFFTSAANNVDLGLAVITAIIQLPHIRHSAAYRWLTLFQVLRSYRVILAVPFTGELIRRVFNQGRSIVNLTLFVFATTWTATLFSTQLIRGDAPSQVYGEDMNITFKSFYNAFLGMYQILSTENWTDLLFGMTGAQGQFGQAWSSAVLFVVWFAFSALVIMSMFIAVLQDTFDISEGAKRREQVRTYLLRCLPQISAGEPISLTLLSLLRTRRGKAKSRRRPDEGSIMPDQQLVQDFLKTEVTSLETRQDFSFQPTFHRAFERAWDAVLVATGLERFKHRFQFNRSFPGAMIMTSATFSSFDQDKLADNVAEAHRKHEQRRRDFIRKNPRFDTAFWIFKPGNIVRSICQRVVHPAYGIRSAPNIPAASLASWTFAVLMYAATLGVVVLACVVTPLYQRGYAELYQLRDLPWFVYCDIAFTLVFTLEFAVKAVADGFLMTPNAYLKNVWNRIDALVLVAFWVTLASDLTNKHDASRVFRAIKALRALRLVNISNATKNTFHDIFISGFWNIAAAAIVSVILLLPFALWGLNMFAGYLFTCNDDGVSTMFQCFGEYASAPSNWDVWAPRAWENPFGYDFDSFGSSLLVLFEIVSQEGWTDLLFTSMSITTYDGSLEMGASPANGLFFVAFNFLGAVFVLTLFIAVIIQNFAERSGTAYLTIEQRSWYEMKSLLKQIRPSRRSADTPTSPLERWAYFAVKKHSRWNKLVFGTHIAHALLLATEHYPSSWQFELVRNICFIIFLVIFMVNLAIRRIALRSRLFWSSWWNVYNLAITIMAFAATLTVLNTDDPTAIIVQKVFLVLTCMNLITMVDSLDQLFKMAIASLPDLVSIFATWLVLFIAFAIAMNQIFGLTKIGDNGSHNLNFRTVSKSLISLFRMTNGENWNSLMHDFAVEPPYCTVSTDFLQSDCGSRAWAYFLFIAWNVLSMYIFVNVVLTVVFHHFSFVYQRTGGMANLSRDEIRGFKRAWAKYDDGSGKIDRADMPRFLHALDGAFEAKIYPTEVSVPALLDACCGGKQHWVGTRDQIETLNRIVSESLDIPLIRRRRKLFDDMFLELDLPHITFTQALLTVARVLYVDTNRGLSLKEFVEQRATESELKRRRAGHAIAMWLSTRIRRRSIRLRHSQRQSASASQHPNRLTSLTIPEHTRATSSGSDSKDAVSPSQVSPFSFTSDRDLEVINNIVDEVDRTRPSISEEAELDLLGGTHWESALRPK